MLWGIDRGNVRQDVGSQCLLPPSGNLLLKVSAILYGKCNWCSDGKYRMDVNRVIGKGNEQDMRYILRGCLRYHGINIRR